ncbi:MAG: autotransporter-associated beta strand repeat-containing protein, partial [Thermoguttaceae bacterium]
MKSPKGNSQILPFPRILSRGRVALLLLGAFWASASFAEPVVYTDDTIPEANIAIGADGVEFQVSGTKTYDYTMSGTGPFYKTGEGTLTLPRTNTYTGATTVSAGTRLFSCDTLPVSAMKATGGTLA